MRSIPGGDNFVGVLVFYQLMQNIRISQRPQLHGRNMSHKWPIPLGPWKINDDSTCPKDVRSIRIKYTTLTYSDPLLTPVCWLWTRSHRAYTCPILCRPHSVAEKSSLVPFDIASYGSPNQSNDRNAEMNTVHLSRNPPWFEPRTSGWGLPILFAK